MPNWYFKSITEVKEKNTVLSKNIGDRISEIKNQKGKNILMFGSPATFEILNSLSLIDEYCVIQYPVFFGNGIPFFSRIQNSTPLKLLDIKKFSEGEMAIHYKVSLQINMYISLKVGLVFHILGLAILVGVNLVKFLDPKILDLLQTG